MAFTYEAILVYGLIPFLCLLGLILIFPFPRFVKKLAFWLVELKIERISSINLGYLFCIIWLIAMIGNYMAYSNFIHQSKEIPGQASVLEKNCEDIRYCNPHANSALRQIRNVLIHAFGFTISIMNFVLTHKQRQVFDLQDKK